MFFKSSTQQLHNTKDTCYIYTYIEYILPYIAVLVDAYLHDVVRLKLCNKDTGVLPQLLPITRIALVTKARKKKRKKNTKITKPF